MKRGTKHIHVAILLYKGEINSLYLIINNNLMKTQRIKNLLTGALLGMLSIYLISTFSSISGETLIKIGSGGYVVSLMFFGPAV